MSSILAGLCEHREHSSIALVERLHYWHLAEIGLTTTRSARTEEFEH